MIPIITVHRSPESVKEAFGHDTHCDMWVVAADGSTLDRTRDCTCGSHEVTDTTLIPLTDREIELLCDSVALNCAMTDANGDEDEDKVKELDALGIFLAGYL